MKEASVGRIVIEDVEPETIECVLRFIYTGALQNDSLSGDMLIELLHCADKYDINELKAETLRRMESSLSTENVMELVSAAKLHGADDETLSNMLLFFKRYDVPDLMQFILDAPNDLNKVAVSQFCTYF